MAEYDVVTNRKEDKAESKYNKLKLRSLFQI